MISSGSFSGSSAHPYGKTSVRMPDIASLDMSSNHIALATMIGAEHHTTIPEAIADRYAMLDGGESDEAF